MVVEGGIEVSAVFDFNAVLRFKEVIFEIQQGSISILVRYDIRLTDISDWETLRRVLMSDSSKFYRMAFNDHDVIRVSEGCAHLCTGHQKASSRVSVPVASMIDAVSWIVDNYHKVDEVKY